jgi:hypothetical protein
MNANEEYIEKTEKIIANFREILKRTPNQFIKQWVSYIENQLDLFKSKNVCVELKKD